MIKKYFGCVGSCGYAPASVKIIPAKGGIMSEDVGRFVPLPKNIPRNYLKLSYPVHNNDKILVGFNRLHVKKYYSYEIYI